MSMVSWTPPDPLDGTASDKAIYIQEIQHNLNHLQETAGITVTQFSTQIAGINFFKSAVEEMKKVMENPSLLGYYGYSSISTLLGHGWTAYSRDVSNQIDVWSYGILNDLRKCIDNLNNTGGGEYIHLLHQSGIVSLTDLKIDTATWGVISTTIFDSIPPPTRDGLFLHTCSDKNFYYVISGQTDSSSGFFFDTRIYKISRTTGLLMAKSSNLIGFDNKLGYRFQNIATDGNFIYLTYTDTIPQIGQAYTITQLWVGKFDAINLTFISKSINIISYFTVGSSIVVNGISSGGKDGNIYIVGNSGNNRPSILTMSQSLGIVSSWSDTSTLAEATDIIVDSTHIYVTYNYFDGIGVRVNKIDKGDFQNQIKSSLIPHDNVDYRYWSRITMNSSDIFVGAPPIISVVIYRISRLNKSNLSLISSRNYDMTQYGSSLNSIDIIHDKEYTVGII